MSVFAIPFPSIDPILFQIGPFAIRWYALAYVAGLLIGWRFARALVSRDSLWGPVNRPTSDQMDDFLLWATLGVVLGGRLGYVLFYNSDYYLQNPAEILVVWQGGMAFHGGFLGVALAMVLFARNKDFSLLSLSDVVSAVVTIGIFFGRIANFINGELYGRVSDVPWAMVFPAGGPEPRHPSQLYEAVLEGMVLFAVLNWLIFRRGALRYPGRITGMFVLGYGLARMIAEFFRTPDAHIGFLTGGLTMGMALSIPMVLAGLLILVLTRGRGSNGTERT
ncbi:MAG: prolipoprotein diacylglyceryl transferase [Pseudomonadota bacterium]